MAAVEFVSLPIASLALCVAICCILAPSAMLHRRCASEVAAIACAHQVLRLDKYLTAEMRCDLVILQHNAVSASGFVGYQTLDDGQFSIVCFVAKFLKTHKVLKLESDHVIEGGKCDLSDIYRSIK